MNSIVLFLSKFIICLFKSKVTVTFFTSWELSYPTDNLDQCCQCSYLLDLNFKTILFLYFLLKFSDFVSEISWENEIQTKIDSNKKYSNYFAKLNLKTLINSYWCNWYKDVVRRHNEGFDKIEKKEIYIFLVDI